MAVDARVAMYQCIKRLLLGDLWYSSSMAALDLNLLVTLDVLLQEASVVGAAQRLGLSASAMSRALARLRDVTGDPLLVRAGRGLVPTPRALELRNRVRNVVDDAEAVLRPALRLDLPALTRTFTIRSSEGFVETFGALLIAKIAVHAPNVRLHFMPKPDKDSTPMRDGTVDLETGITGKTMGPEVRTQSLFRDRFVGVVRKGHALAKGKMTAERYALQMHVLISRRGLEMGPVDRALEVFGLSRHTGAIVSGFTAAIALARASDMVATVPDIHTRGLADGMHRFLLPLSLRDFTISLFWHPRLDADPAHKWLRTVVHAVCTESASLGDRSQKIRNQVGGHSSSKFCER